MHLLFKDHPTVNFRLTKSRDILFAFLVNPLYSDNIICADFVDFWLREKSQVADIEGIYEYSDSKRVICADGKLHLCQGIKYSFSIDNQEFSTLFYIDRHHLPYHHIDSSTVGILGLDFLIENEWIIDFGKEIITDNMNH